MPYELDELKKLAYAGKKPKDLNVHESVLYHTMWYCYRAYEKDPSEYTRQRLKDFLEPVIEFHYGRKY